ncbi:hypothetical protein [Amycolatopsis sp. H20-H5]|uniref:hypothetical protein n=1 Tax=Amycolatopsis sp. H20-H5 TaxID=3046309 RepID=UPI002DBE5E4B|nr:hypothetical protein [Amycolatopsis sp. H20-H5]MEC3977877.1 hypothetical protein [Amycolatopsis sp. H20-H5]
MPLLTGDRYLDSLVPSAVRLIRAVRQNRPMPIEAVFADAETIYDRPLDAARALVILLAAMVPDDRTAGDLLRWRANPHEYLRLRAAGLNADAAAMHAAMLSPSGRRSSR